LEIYILLPQYCKNVALPWRNHDTKVGRGQQGTSARLPGKLKTVLNVGGLLPTDGLIWGNMLAPKYIEPGFQHSATSCLLSAALFVMPGIPPACAAGPAPKQQPTPQYQTLTFPDTAPVARFDLNVPTVDAKGAPAVVRRKITARGKIQLPIDCNVTILLLYDGVEHLQTLSQLNPAQVIQINAASLDLDDAQFAFFKRFPAIVRINLDSTMVTDKSMPVIGTFKSLSDLRLSKIDVTGSGFDALNGLGLKILELNGSNLKEGNLQKIKSLPGTLYSLNCSRTHIGNADMAFIGKCQKLTSLNLDGDKKITDACIEDIAKLKLLDYLNIADTGMTEKSLPILAKMPNLKHLVVRNSTFWKEGSGKSPLSTLKISDSVAVSRTPVDVFTPLH
jgi:hypothetical protein